MASLGREKSDASPCKKSVHAALETKMGEIVTFNKLIPPKKVFTFSRDRNIDYTTSTKENFSDVDLLVSMELMR